MDRGCNPPVSLPSAAGSQAEMPDEECLSSLDEERTSFGAAANRIAAAMRKANSRSFDYRSRRRAACTRELKGTVVNKLSIVASALMVSVSLPAVAGPDFQLIERGRQAKQAAQESCSAMRSERDKRCDVRPVAQPLDHGPRAQTTPYLNRLRLERSEARIARKEGA